ncbi:unnamed protein product [Oikopleura dioica]|uniref:Uncharacterized protein n=1 Tax=Oikopleura dioica TaxID=34765 RepID=E4YEZ9_OIKDI|nr:unnamed protein product [Oikopleura dioica]
MANREPWEIEPCHARHQKEEMSFDKLCRKVLKRQDESERRVRLDLELKNLEHRQAIDDLSDQLEHLRSDLTSIQNALNKKWILLLKIFMTLLFSSFISAETKCSKRGDEFRAEPRRFRVFFKI